MEDENARMAAMKAKFEEEIAQLRESNKTLREEAEREATANRDLRRSWRGLGRKGRWAHPSPDKVVVMQLIVEELLFRLWAPC